MSEKQLLRGRDMWPIVRDMFGLGHLTGVRQCVIRVAAAELVQVSVDFYPEREGVPAPPTERYYVVPMNDSTVSCEVSE